MIAKINNVQSLERILGSPYIQRLLNREVSCKTAASLSRIRSHIEGGEPFAIMTAWKSDMTTREKKDKNKVLKSDIRSRGYGVIGVMGASKEGDVPVDYEENFFIIGIPRNEAIALGQKYNQYCVLWGDKDEGVFIFYMSGGHDELDKKINFNNLNAYYTQYKRHTFWFPPAVQPEQRPEDRPEVQDMTLQPSDMPLRMPNESVAAFKRTEAMFILPDGHLSRMALHYNSVRRLYNKYGLNNVIVALDRCERDENINKVVSWLRNIR